MPYVTPNAAPDTARRRAAGASRGLPDGPPQKPQGAHAARGAAAVVVCDVHGVAWRVLDIVPGVDGGPGARWAVSPAPDATGRAFIATVDGRKRVRVLDRHRTDPWDDLSLPTLRDQLDDAHPPPPGWVARHARPHPVRSSLLYR